MKTLTCDVCRHKMEEPVTGRTYFHICHRDLCEPCKDDLEALIKPVLRSQEPFNYEWYTKLIRESVEKAVQKGKF